MQALLGLGGLRGVGDALRSNEVCDSIDDVQRRLHSCILSKSTETRADHILLSFELPLTTVFYISEEPEINGADGDHSAQPQQATRTVTVSETVQDQPSDDPALQKAVAKHISVAIGVADSSSWNVRQVSRAAQGWTFTYLCKHSLQTWNRQNAKNPGRPVIGAFSGNGGLDPVNLSRPAFDCRGTLSIAFSKSSRAIVVKYEHTPLHKTVSDLVSRLLPVLPPPPVANGNTAVVNKSSKAKRPPPVEGEESGRKTTKRKSKAADSTEEVATYEDGSQPQEAAVEPISASVHATSILNIPPLEAARRRELAIILLTGKNIDPTTLSPEQFNIFANQAPHLQELSLGMLSQYGAERLRIVHPDEKDQPASSTAIPAQQSTPETRTTGATAAATPATTHTPSKKRSRQKPKRIVTDSPAEGATKSAVPDDISVPTINPTQKSGRPRKTRGTCDTCRQNQRNCTKEHPECSTCIDAGETCIYLAPKPRSKSNKSTDVVVPENLNVLRPDEHQHQMDYTQPTQITQPIEPMRPMEPQPQTTQNGQLDPDNDEFIPDPNILSGPIEQSSGLQRTAAGYFQSQGSELAFSEPSNARPASQPFAQPQVPKDTSQSSPALGYPSNIQSAQPVQQSSALAFPTSASTAQTSRPTRESTSRNSNRRSGPAAEGPQPQRAGLHTAVQEQFASSWNTAPHSPAPSSRTSPNSPTVSQQQTSKRPRSRKSGVNFDHQVFDGTQADAPLLQTAMQQQKQPAQTTKSPYLSAAQKPSSRATSRQGHRSQTQTSVLQVPTSHSRTASNASYNAPTTASTSSADPAYSSYTRYNATSNDQSSSRIPYEPSSYNAHVTTAVPNSFTAVPSYEYPQRMGTDNALSQALGDTSGLSRIDSSNSNQWLRPQSPTSQSNAAPSRTTTPYNVSTRTQTPSSHSHGTRPGQHQTTAQSPAYNQAQQPHSYGSHSSQQPSTDQQQNQNWYGFHSANANTNSTSYTSNARNSGYGNNSTPSATGYNHNQRSDMPGYSGYSGGDDLYDLLGTNGSGH